MDEVRIVAAILKTRVREPFEGEFEHEQWRKVSKILSPKYYRFPFNDLAILVSTF